MKKRILFLFTIIAIFVLIGCGEKIEYIDNEDPHIYGEWIDEVKPTCESDGILGHYHCSHCGKNFDQFFNELPSIENKTNGHTLVHSKEIPATGWSTGIKEYYECSKCGKIYTDQFLTNEIDKEDLIIPIKVVSIHEIKDCPNHQMIVTVRAVVVGATSNTDGGYTYYILKDLDSNETLCLRNCRDGDIPNEKATSCIKGYSYAPNMVFPLGSIVEIPVTFQINNGYGGEAYKDFLIWRGDDYEDAIGYGTMLEWKEKYIVGYTDDYAVDKEKVTVTISSNSDLDKLLVNGGGFQNNTICIEGTNENPLKFVTGVVKEEAKGDINREYLYFYYGDASSLNDIKVNGTYPVFSNFGNTFNMISPLSCTLSGQTKFEQPDFTKPYEFVGKIYATCVGGNSTFYHFVVLDENDIINEGNTGSHEIIGSKIAKNTFFKYMEQFAETLGIDIHGDITTAVGTTNIITTSDLCRIGIKGIYTALLQDIWNDFTHTGIITGNDGTPREVTVNNVVLNKDDCKNYIAPYYTIVGTKSGGLNYENKYRSFINNLIMVVEGPNNTYIVGAVANQSEDAATRTYPSMKALFDLLVAKYNGQNITEFEKKITSMACAGVIIPKEKCEPDNYDWFSNTSNYVNFTKNAEQTITTASCWKTMTACAALSYITEADFQKLIYVGSTELNSIASTPKFYGDEWITFEDALHYMMLSSSNVTPNVIARGVGEMMLRKVLEERTARK
jgi:DNA-directed RNA polymerase subunit RPC12/RpoP